ncbi:MAG TPA: cytochrome c peroxidase [Blastocatellia bacterium]|nr:cytochrome c peroxidase [Blastocatellia bacterium]
MTTLSKRPALAIVIIFVVVHLASWAFGGDQKDRRYSAAVSLGARLFADDGFSAPNGDFRNSCKSCHLLDDDPQGLRAHTEFLNRSWVPWRTEDPRRSAARNAPTLLDTAHMPRLHFDGEFKSLEELVKGTLAGRPMGWLPGEQSQAFDRIYGVVMGPAYRDRFKKAYGIDLERQSRDDVINWTATALSDYLRSLKTERNAAYDSFVSINALETGPREGEPVRAFAERMIARVSALEAKRELKLPRGFDASALEGMKIFFRTEGAASAGNCVACHVPPLFTDFTFHNIGVSQSQYDDVHGEGSFAALKIPDAASAVRPSAQFREPPSAQKPGDVDLGYWNFVELRSPSRPQAESEDQLLRRAIAAFKTPTLRNLAFTNPYMHDGEFATLESALAEVMRMSTLARAGRVREADGELGRIRIAEADIPYLAAFLNTLNEDFKRAPRPGK